MEGWMPLPETEPPAGPVLLVVIARTVQHMPALWDGTPWTWLNGTRTIPSQQTKSPIGDICRNFRDHRAKENYEQRCH